MALSVDCNYQQHRFFGYSCELINVSYHNENDEFIIEGQHLDSYNDEDVLAVFTSFSNFSFVPKEILQRFKNLEELLLSQMEIKTIDGLFQVCDKLQVMTFYRNKLKRIESRAFEHCPNLNYLDLGENQISEIHFDAFENLAKLETLVLDSNPVVIFDSRTFDKLTNLKFLYMSGTEIPKLYPWTIKNLKKLERFYFGSNFLVEKTVIDSGTFKSMHSLQTLSLSMKNAGEMEIEPRAFYDLPNLVQLVLAENSIKKLNSNSFVNLPNLTWFSIENNKIEGIETNFFSNFPTLIHVAAKENFCINETFYFDSLEEKEIFLNSFEGCYSKWENSITTTESKTEPSTTMDSTTVTTQGASAGKISCIGLLMWFIMKMFC